MAKKNNYIEEELAWLTLKAAQIKKYVDEPPMHELSDRIETLNGPTGPSEKIAATVEAQLKSKRDALKDYTLILEAIDKLREKEEAKKIEARGNTSMNGLMSSQLQANK